MSKSYRNTLSLTRAAMIAALYMVLTVVTPFTMNFGAAQFRIAEALTLLPVLMPEAVPGLLVGCLLANLLGGGVWFDVVLGSVATLLAALCTRKLHNNIWLAAAMPTLFNGLIVGPVVYFAYVRAPGAEISFPLLWSTIGTVALGEIVVCYVLGIPLVHVLKRLPGKYLRGE